MAPILKARTTRNAAVGPSKEGFDVNSAMAAVVGRALLSIQGGYRHKRPALSPGVTEARGSKMLRQLSASRSSFGVGPRGGFVSPDAVIIEWRVFQSVR